jgi:VanZ family protein
VSSQSATITHVSTQIHRLGKMWFMRNFKYWIPVIVGMIFIYCMSTEAFSSRSTLRIIDQIVRFLSLSLSRNEIIMINGAVRKLAHVIEYAVFGILLLRAFRAGSQERLWSRWAGYSLAVALLYAMIDEFHQLHVPMRTASLVDVCYDTLGSLLGQCVSIIYYDRQQPKIRD